MKHIGKFAVLGAVLAASATSAFATTYTLSSFGSAGLSSYQPYTGAGDDATESAVQYSGFYGDSSISATTPYACGPTATCGSTSVQSAESAQTFANLSTYTAKSGSAVEQNPVVGTSNVWNSALPNSAWVSLNANAGPVGTSANNGNNPPYGFYEYTDTFTDGVVGTYAGSISVLSDDSVEAFLNGVLILPFGGVDGFSATQTSTFTTSLLAGTNTLTFIVAQEGNIAQNDPTGLDFTASIAPTPEPSSLLLLGTGLVGAAGMMFRRRLAA